ALAQIGALAELIQCAQDEDVRVRARSVRALAWFGPDAKEAVPVLTAALQDPNDSVRSAAIEALGEVGPEAKQAVPTLARILRGSPVAMQEQVLIALGRMGPAAIAPLVEIAGDSNSPVRLEALRSLVL